MSSFDEKNNDMLTQQEGAAELSPSADAAVPSETATVSVTEPSEDLSVSDAELSEMTPVAEPSESAEVLTAAPSENPFVSEVTPSESTQALAAAPSETTTTTAAASGQTAAEPVVAKLIQPVMSYPANAARPFSADATDAIFALIFSCVGYFYICAVETLFNYGGYAFSPVIWKLWVFPLFVCVYAAAVLGYLYKRKIAPSQESWVWLGVLLALGVPLPFYTVSVTFQLMLLHLVALYWPLCAAGGLLCGGKTGGALPFDACNAGLIVPWGNFFSHIRVLFKIVTKRGPRTKWGRHIALIALGLLLTVPVLLIVMPLLASADAAFYDLLDSINHWINRFIEGSAAEFFGKVILSLPVTCILFGSVYGAIHRRCTNVFVPQHVHAVREQARLVPTTAVTTVFCVVGAVYALFLGLQGSYIFGAFAGRLPETFSYSGYAREGFFELCRIGGVNLTVLAVSNLVCRKPRRENRVLRVCNVVLCVLSLLLTATAAAKLGMYIAAHGLTVNRVLPAVFLVWIATVFVAVMVWQLRSFSVVRFAVLTLAVMVAITCAVDVPDLCIAYNDARLRAGTLDASVNYKKSYDAWGLGTYGML